MSEFVDFCNEWLKRYKEDFNNPDMKFTDDFHLIFMRSKKYERDRFMQVPMVDEFKHIFQKIIDKHSPQMYLIALTTWSSTSKNTNLRPTDDPEREEMVIAIGKTMDGKEKFCKAFRIDDKRKLHEISDVKDFITKFLI